MNIPKIPSLSKPTSLTGQYMSEEWLKFFNELLQYIQAVTSGEVLSEDPTDPENNTWWIVAEPGSPLTTISLKVRLYDTTYLLASIDVPTPP